MKQSLCGFLGVPFWPLVSVILALGFVQLGFPKFSQLHSMRLVKMSHTLLNISQILGQNPLVVLGQSWGQSFVFI